MTALDDEPAHRILYQDAEGDQQLFNIFALLILAGASFAAFNLATRIVEAQRREIGVGMALGVPPASLRSGRCCSAPRSRSPASSSGCCSGWRWGRSSAGRSRTCCRSR